ncbi:MAG: S-layer homology domain-containing protein, partial [Firmicutes bacterium]|nr:S-layer homology domain-containing protein [Bacillota bacterium]
AEAVSNDFEDYALEFLVNKNIWKGVSAEELIADAESNVERWQMALLVSRISTGWLDDEAWEDDVANDSTFTDLAGTVAENYLGAISYANQNGIIEGYTAEKFGPTDNITYRDGLTMAIRTLGYKGLAYPWGYIEKAVELGLTEGIDKAYTADLTRGEVACILYNALFAATKSGETLAKSIFDVDFGWENIVITCATRGYLGNFNDCSKCPAGYVGFKILADDNDATLSAATYYVKATELGLETAKGNQAQQLIGATYLALFEVADNGLVNMIEAHDLMIKEVWNAGSQQNARFELMKYNLVTKYYDTPYISEADKPELMLFAHTATKTFVVDKTQVAVDVNTLNILKKDSSGNWKVEWWYDQVNNQYYKVLWNDDSGKVSVDFMDETIFEEWYAEAIQVAKTTIKRYALTTDPDTATAYSRLRLYDVDGDGVADRALYKTYQLAMLTVWDAEWDWAGSKSAAGLVQLDMWDASDDWSKFGSTGYVYTGVYILNFLQEWSIECGEEVTEFTSINDLTKFMYAPQADGKDFNDMLILCHFDENAKNIDIQRVIHRYSEDENNGIFTGMLKGYTVTASGTSKINLDGRILPIGYDNLPGSVFTSLRSQDEWGGWYINDHGKIAAQMLNKYLWKYIKVTLVDGKVVDIDNVTVPYQNEAIVVLGYAGITAKDNLIAVYGYSTFDIRDDINDKKVEHGVQIYKIASFNGWHKGDYKYYPMNALEDAMFMPGSIYTITSYDEALDAYHVETQNVSDIRDTAKKVKSITFERGYRVWDGNVQTMSANDKYMFIDANGLIKVYDGVVTNDNWSIKNAKYISISEVWEDTNGDYTDELTDRILLFFLDENSEVTGFSSVYQTDIVLYDEDSYVMNYAYDADITDDAILGAGDRLLGSVQQSSVVVTNMMTGAQMTVRAANNVDFKVGTAYMVVGGVIIGEWYGFGTNLDGEPLFNSTEEFIELAKSLYWDSEEAAAMYTYDGGRYIILDAWLNEDGSITPATLTMTLGGTDSWWVETDNLAIGLLANNCGYGWKHPEIAEGLAVCGGYAGFARYTVDANGKISNTNWMPEITDSKSWNGKAHKVVCVYDTETVLFTFFDLGEVPAEIN